MVLLWWLLQQEAGCKRRRRALQCKTVAMHLSDKGIEPSSLSFFAPTHVSRPPKKPYSLAGLRCRCSGTSFSARRCSAPFLLRSVRSKSSPSGKEGPSLPRHTRQWSQTFCDKFLRSALCLQFVGGSHPALLRQQFRYHCHPPISMISLAIRPQPPRPCSPIRPRQPRQRSRDRMKDLVSRTCRIGIHVSFGSMQKFAFGVVCGLGLGYHEALGFPGLVAHQLCLCSCRAQTQ